MPQIALRLKARSIQRWQQILSLSIDYLTQIPFHDYRIWIQTFVPSELVKLLFMA